MVSINDCVRSLDVAHVHWIGNLKLLFVFALGPVMTIQWPLVGHQVVACDGQHPSSRIYWLNVAADSSYAKYLKQVRFIILTNSCSECVNVEHLIALVWLLVNFHFYGSQPLGY